MKKKFLKTNLGKYISFITYYLKSIFASLQSRLILSHRIISLIKIAFSEKRKKIRETKIYTIKLEQRHLMGPWDPGPRTQMKGPKC